MSSSEGKSSEGLRREGYAVASSSGIVIGRAHKLCRGKQPVHKRMLEAAQVEAEVKRLIRAIDAACNEVDVERQHLLEHGSHDMLLLLDAHRMLIDDPELQQRVTQRISEERINAEWALQQEMAAIRQRFEQIDDEYLRNRKDDVEHAGKRILNHLLGNHTDISTRPDTASSANLPAIYVGDDFSVSDIVNIWRHGAAGVVIEQGGIDAHNIIVARGIGLPALVGAGDCLANLEEGEVAILDAERGCWIAAPESHEEAEYRKLISGFDHAQAELDAYACIPSRSSDGHELKLMSNIEFPEELEVAEHIGIDGIGLYRSEFLLLDRPDIPDEEAQYREYAEIVRRMAGKPITMRLFDIGGDKRWHHHELICRAEGCANPALGLRGIRLLLRWPDILEGQLRAMLRAGEEGAIHILVPMVTTEDEVKEVRKIAEHIHRKEGFTQPISIGSMIEVPASAIDAERLAKVSDFFSIGTNDLMQYTLAADRTDEEVATLYKSGHTAILHLIKLAISAAREAEIPVSVCGELSSCPEWTATFLNLGVDSLSMSLNRVLHIRRELSQLTYQPIT